MLNFFSKLIIIVVLSLPLAVLAPAPGLAQESSAAPTTQPAQPNFNDAGTALNQIAGLTGLEKNLSFTTGAVINTVLALVGTIFFILTVYAGIRWMTAQGNEDKVTKAKDTLEAALIGLAIIFLAYAITAFVTDRLTRSSPQLNQIAPE